jgi:hypothetical protein
MLRVFGHFVPVPAVLVGLCEILLMSAALYVAIAPVNPALAANARRYVEDPHLRADAFRTVETAAECMNKLLPQLNAREALPDVRLAHFPATDSGRVIAEVVAALSGTGIASNGAFQTRALIRAAGCELNASSTPGADTTVRIFLPLASEGAVSSRA